MHSACGENRLPRQFGIDRDVGAGVRAVAPRRHRPYRMGECGYFQARQRGRPSKFND